MEIAADISTQLQDIKDLSDEPYTKEQAEYLIHMVVTFLSVDPHIISESLFDELSRVEFDCDIGNKESIYSLSIPPIIEKFNQDGEVVSITWSDFLFLQQGYAFRLVAFPYGKIEGDELHHPLPVTVMGHDDYRKIVPESQDDPSQLIVKIIHYIEHLGRPDLRKGLNPQTQKPKKLKRLFRQQEQLLFDHTIVTLGFGKERLYKDKSWLQKPHIRRQPYGPRDNPKYKPILIAEMVKRRKKQLE